MTKLESAEEFVRATQQRRIAQERRALDIAMLHSIEARDRAVAKKVLEGLAHHFYDELGVGAAEYIDRKIANNPAELDRLIKE